MNAEKPFIEQMPSAQDVQSYVGEKSKNIGESITSSLEGVKSSLNEFSNKSVLDASGEFLDSNSLLAKFSFLLLVIIVFVILLKLFMVVISYFTMPSGSPYIVKGSLNGNEYVILNQDPSKDKSTVVLKSNDRNSGIEFSWSMWLFLNGNVNAQNALQNVFVKGDATFNTTTGLNLVNGPGVYLSPFTVANNNEQTYSLFVVMDNIGGATQPSIALSDPQFDASGNIATNDTVDSIRVAGVPLQKWVNVVVRLQNMVLDVYINGTIVGRHYMKYIPRQNFNNVTVGGNKGYDGKLSDLRYHDYALSVFEINNIVMFGPNTTASSLSSDSKAASGNYTY